MGLLRKLVNDSRAIASLELAIISPIFLLMIFGLNEIPDYVRAFPKAGAAAGAVATVIAAQTSVVHASSGAGSLGDYCLAAEATMRPYAISALTVKVASRTMNAAGMIATDWDTVCYTNSASANATDPAPGLNDTVPAGLLNVPGDSVIEVEVIYGYTSPSQFFLQNAITISQTVYARPRGNATIS
jgi:Flp pilus assembly protein TadG